MPARGLHYPGSYGELRAWFPDDEACMDYLDWLRWPSGPVQGPGKVAFQQFRTCRAVPTGCLA